MRYVDDSYQDDDDFNEIDDEMMADAIARSNKNHEDSMKIANKQLDQALLDKAIFISKSCWFWGLLPHSVRLFRIANTYNILKKLSKD